MTRHPLPGRHLAAMLAGAGLLAACSHVPPAPPASAGASTCMQLRVSQLRVGEGTLMAAAYGSAETFFKTPVWQARAVADQAQLTLQVCGITAPELAFTVFQDMNGNGRLDMNPMGIPAEPYGVSGRPGFGAPSWSGAKVPAGAGLSVEIGL